MSVTVVIFLWNQVWRIYVDPQKWLDTLESLTFQLQNKKGLWKCQNWHILRRVQKIFHIKLIKKAWGKIISKIMWRLISTKTDFTEFFICENSSFWPNLKAKIWDLMNFGLTKVVKDQKIQFWTSWFLSSVYWIHGSVCPCVRVFF